MSSWNGTRSAGGSLHAVISGYSNAAVTAGQVLTEYTAMAYGRIGGVMATAGAAATGAGNTVLDVLINGTSIWGSTANRPTLATASFGSGSSSFTNTQATTRKVRPGDIITLKVISIPASTGHGRVALTVGLEND